MISQMPWGVSPCYKTMLEIIITLTITDIQSFLSPILSFGTVIFSIINNNNRLIVQSFLSPIHSFGMIIFFHEAHIAKYQRPLRLLQYKKKGLSKKLIGYYSTKKRFLEQASPHLAGSMNELDIIIKKMYCLPGLLFSYSTPNYSDKKC